MQANADANVVRHSLEIEIPPLRGDLARVIEERDVHPETIGEPAPFTLEQQTVQVAESLRVIGAQRRSAAEGRHQEVGHIAVECGLHAAAQ